MEQVILIVAVVLALLVVVGIRNTAKKNKGPLGRLMRWWWNTSFKIVSYIPFCGWMAHFIFEDEADREDYIKAGEQADEIGLRYAEKKAAQEKAEEAARQERLQNPSWEDLQEELRGRAYRELGTRDVHLSKDGTRVRVGDSDYMTVEEFKRKLYR